MLRGIKQFDQDHTDSVSEPELKSKFFWLQRYFSGWKKYFPGEIPHRYNCWSLSPINFRFIAWENYLKMCFQELWLLYLQSPHEHSIYSRWSETRLALGRLYTRGVTHEWWKFTLYWPARRTIHGKWAFQHYFYNHFE